MSEELAQSLFDPYQLPDPVRIIGVLDDGATSLSSTALAHIRTADLVVGGERTLALFASEFAEYAQTFDIGGQLMQAPDRIRAAQDAGLSVVVLATGDPLCHGIASFLQARLCIESCEVMPNLSTVQLACARVGMAWQQLEIVSVHNKDAGEWQAAAGTAHGLYPVLRAVQQHMRVAVLTSPANSPDRLARMLVQAGLQDTLRMAVASQLMQADEQLVNDISPADAATMRFPDLNVVLIWRIEPLANPVVLGNADASFHQRKPEKGLITKREVRAVSLARLQLRRDSIVWDIGAGSGSVGLEAATLCPDGYVYAVEKNPEDFAIAGRNASERGASNYHLIHAKAPDGMVDWLAPDAVFVGGSGGELSTLITLILNRLKPGGCLVMNFVTIENLGVATQTLKTAGVQWDIIQLQASRCKPVLHMHRFAAENPVWLVCAQSNPSDITSIPAGIHS